MFKRKQVAPITPTKYTPRKSNETRMSNGTIIASKYRLLKTIGKGSYGKVKLAETLQGLRKVAIKFIAKSSIKKPAHTTRIQREINLMKTMYHENICGLEESFETELDIILVMEWIDGCDLFDSITGKPTGRYTEQEARHVFSKMVAAISYCHENKIIHRDLKPENVMIGKDSIKLIDFGFANLFHPRGNLTTNCGSPLYASPEIVKGVPYRGPEVDIWSLGVVLFAMITGSLPFEDDQLKGLYGKICSGTFRIPEHVSIGARDLIKGMMTVDHRKRLTIDQVSNHPWLIGFNASISTMKIAPSTIRYPSAAIIEQMKPFGYTDPQRLRVVLQSDLEDPAVSIYKMIQRKNDILNENLFTPPPTPSKANTNDWLNIEDDGVVGQAIASAASQFKRIRGIAMGNPKRKVFE